MAKQKKIKTTNHAYALVTGASMGIGRALSIETAKRGYHLALVALPGSNLEKLAAYIRKHFDVTVIFMEIDLTTPQAPMQIFHWIKKENITLQILINNAGLGHLGPFTDYSYEFYQKLIRLNIESVVLLSRLFIPELQKNYESYILNLGSIASFFPIPYKVAYAGSKMFVYSFSRALREELKKDNIKVSVLCPGPILTNQDVIARIRKGGFWGKLSCMRAQDMAKTTLNKLFRGKAVIIPGAVNKLLTCLNFILPPGLKQQILARKFSVQHKIEHDESKTGEDNQFRHTANSKTNANE